MGGVGAPRPPPAPLPPPTASRAHLAEVLLEGGVAAVRAVHDDADKGKDPRARARRRGARDARRGEGGVSGGRGSLRRRCCSRVGVARGGEPRIVCGDEADLDGEVRAEAPRRDHGVDLRERLGEVGEGDGPLGDVLRGRRGG